MLFNSSIMNMYYFCNPKWLEQKALLSKKDDIKKFWEDFIFFWPHSDACGTLVLQPGVEPVPSAVKAQSPNHWNTREFS